MISSVKKLKHYLDILTVEFGTHTDLNKSSSKYNRCNGNYSKGVESDYIRIYKMNKINNLDFNFALSFTNPEDSTKSLIQMTYKLGDTVFNGKIYKFEDFKDKLKEFINAISILKSLKSKSSEAVKTTIYTIFDFENQTSTENMMIEECQNKIDDELKELTEKESFLQSINKKRFSKYQNSSKEIDEFYKRSVKELGIDVLKEQLKELNDILNNLMTEKRNKLQLNLLKRSFEDSSLELRQISYQMDFKIENVLRGYPTSIKKHFEKKKV